MVGAMVGVTVGAMVGAMVGATVGAMVGVTVGVTVGAMVGATLGVTAEATVGAGATPRGRRAPQRPGPQPPAWVVLLVQARCRPPRDRMHIAGMRTRRQQSHTAPHCHARTQLSRRRGPGGNTVTRRSGSWR
jgi:hypothetical protein